MFWNSCPKGFFGLLRIFSRLAAAVYFAVGVLATADAAQAGTSSLREMPEALRGAVSGAIGLHDLSYHVERAGESCRGANPAQHLRVGWSEGGLAVQAGKLSWGLRLEAWGYGDEPAPVGRAVPEASEHRVEYQRSGLTEWYVNGPIGIEQGFTAPAPPKGRSSGEALTLRLSWSGDVRVQVEQNEAVVSNFAGEPVLRYGGLSARDASGRELRSWLERRGADILIRVDDRAATYPVVIDPFIEQQKLTASDGAAGDTFGVSAALSADGATALIGAYFATVGGKASQGAAYVYVKSGGTWTQQAKLIAPDGAAYDYFGHSAALSADGASALIGAGGAKVGSNTQQGAAYVFVNSGGTWSQQQKLTAPDGAAGDYFGGSTALSSDGGAALIGAGSAKVGSNKQQGAAYVFVDSGGSWGQQAKLTASDGAAGDYFGGSAALGSDGASALIGARYATVAANANQGAAYVFVKNGGTWSQQAKLTASDGAAGDYFSGSAALSANGAAALIGANGAKVGGNTQQGAAYAFVNSGGSWSQQQKLSASDGAGGDSFGSSAALSADGSTAVIGASGAGAGQGAAYVFVKSGGTLSQQEKLIAPDGAAGDSFGRSAALSADGGGALIGADHAGVGSNSQQAAAYVFVKDGLVVNFGASGLWCWRDGAWSELTPLTPGMMAAYGNDMAAVFAGAGLYRYDGAAWTQLTPILSIDRIAGAPDRIYVDFTGAGLWQYNGAWTRITALNPNKMLVFGDKLLANFPGAGLYEYDGSSWTQLTPLSSADSMVAGGSTVYVDFPSAGLYAYSGGTWTGLTSLNPTMMEVYYGNKLAANFASFGLYSWNGSSWTQLTSIAAQGLLGTSTDLYVNFGTSGLYKYNAGWTQITPLSPSLMGLLGPWLVANFSGSGLYAYDGSAWSQLTPLSSASAAIEATWP